MKTEGPRERKGTTLNRVPMSLRLTQGDENRVSVCPTGRTREPLPTKATAAAPYELKKRWASTREGLSPLATKADLSVE
jgi:hypothetical protein